MDLRIEMECNGCGWPFRRRLNHLHHGMYLTCPFCHSSDIKLKADILLDDPVWSDSFDPLPEDRAVERKFKLD